MSGHCPKCGEYTEEDESRLCSHCAKGALPMNVRSKINAYTCPACGYRTVTIDRDEGVTPFMLGCRNPLRSPDGGCEGMAESAFYRCEQWLAPEWEWYRPDANELRGMSPEMREHCQQGGLNIRRIESTNKEPRS